jgi:hypothetical protein
MQKLYNLPEDSPSLEPLFDFNILSAALYDLLVQNRASAFVLGIHGPWGSGKTTLLEALRRSVQSKDTVIVDFNAWKYQDREALWRALILRVLGEVRSRGGDEKKLDELQQSLYRSFVEKDHGPLKIDWQAVFTEAVLVLLRLLKLDILGGVLATSVGWVRDLLGGEKAKEEESAKELERIGKIFQRETIERSIEHVTSIEQFLELFRDLMKSLGEKGLRVFVLVDDLDRCLPESALEVFEAIKLFLDAPLCTYIVAVDRDVIRRGLTVRYKESNAGAVVDPDEYIEKTISLSFDLPLLAPGDVRSIISKYQLPVSLDEEHVDRIINGLGPNPRRVKRFMNSLALQLHVASKATESNRKFKLSPLDKDNLGLFIKLNLMSYRNTAVFSSMLREPALVFRLQNAAAAYSDALVKGNVSEAFAKLAAGLAKEIELVQATARDHIFWNIVKDGPSLALDKGKTQTMLAWFRAVSAVNPPTPT